MKSLRSSSFMVVLFLIVCVSVFLAYSGTASAQTKPAQTKPAQTKPAQTKPALANEDCLKCHDAPPADIAASGGKHKDVGCIGCHAGHPPKVKNPIPQCSECHMGKAHFEIKGCLNCHKNPHTPLKISFTGKVTDVCITCHTSQITQLRDNNSKHSAFDCSFCHSVHRQIPQCTQCHKPHSADMVVDDCKKCHKAHMPKKVTYAADTPSKDCGTCHKVAINLLVASKAKHSALACAFCHQEKHKTIPKCQDCHGAPHAAGMMKKFQKCGDCHNIAHDLNNWPVTQTKEPIKAAPKEVQKEAPRKKR